MNIIGTQPPPQNNIVFYTGHDAKELMRITADRITVNPEMSVDEAAKLVIAALESHIQHIVRNAVATEREACAKVCLTEWTTLGQMEAGDVFAAAIRSRT